MRAATSQGLPLLTLEHVSKHYARSAPAVLRDVNLVIRRSCLIELTGSNGAGKSTLLKIAAGLTSATGGRIDRGGSTLSYAPSAALETSGFTAYSYLRHTLHLRRQWSLRTRSAVHELADSIGLTPGLNVTLAHLSTGNHKKVLLMQALLPQADLILLDEPFDGLDASARELILELFQATLTKGSALVVATHSPEVAHLGKRLMLHNGELVEHRTPGGSSVRVAVSIRLANEHWKTLPAIPIRVTTDLGEFDVAEHEVSALLRAALDMGGEILRVDQRTRS